jgi:hypothetical protein
VVRVLLYDNFELFKRNESVTSSNLMTYCKVTQVKPGELKFEGDGFTLKMTYDPQIVTPDIQYIKINDNTLKRYWPNGVTRVVLKYIETGIKGSQSITFTQHAYVQTWKAPEKVIEKLSKDKSGFNYREENVPAYILPDLFTSNGVKIASADEWNKTRRPEIIELFRKNVYGRVPETQFQEKFKVVSLDKQSLDGIATRKNVKISIETTGRSLIFNLIVYTPNNVILVC